MQIDQRVNGDVTVVVISGDITLSKGGDVLLKDKIQSLLQQGHRKILLDLGDVSYVDSAGLGQLVQVYATTSHPAVAEAAERHEAAEGSAGRHQAADGVRLVRQRGRGAGQLQIGIRNQP